MKDNKVERLKKRLTGDAICCIIIAVVMGVFAIAELSMYFSCNGEFANMLNGSVQGLVMSITFVIISLIIFEIMKHGKPFSKRIIVKLRVLGIWVMLSAYLLDVVSFIVEFLKNNEGYFFPDMSNVFVSLLGVLLIIISEIFYYGHELQEDVDSIA